MLQSSVLGGQPRVKDTPVSKLRSQPSLHQQPHSSCSCLQKFVPKISFRSEAQSVPHTSVFLILNHRFTYAVVLFGAQGGQELGEHWFLPSGSLTLVQVYTHSTVKPRKNQNVRKNVNILRHFVVLTTDSRIPLGGALHFCCVIPPRFPHVPGS